MMLLPDEQIATVYKSDVEANMKQGASLAFAHGFNVHYGQVVPRADLDVWMVAPKAPGHTVRSTYTQGRRRSAPDRRSCRQVRQGARPGAQLRGCQWRRQGRRDRDQLPRRDRDRPVRRAGGAVRRCGRADQGRLRDIDRSGYAPEMAYFECLHELKLIVDLIYEGGIANMNYSISNNAEYGEYVTGPKIVNDETREVMRKVLKDIQTGEYAKSFIIENRAGAPTLMSRRRLMAEHPIEVVGEQLRAMMPWIKKNRLVDQSKN
jgi:ketol-acid reductoisomerase